MTRKTATDRRTATDLTHASIKQTLATLNQSLPSFMTDVRDIRTYLKEDLSEAGIATMGAAADRSMENRHGIVDLLDKVIEDAEEAI